MPRPTVVTATAADRHHIGGHGGHNVVARPEEVSIVCRHRPRCPEATAPDREAASVLVAHPEQGWSLLCNGVICFDDTGLLLPDGTALPPHRGPALHTRQRMPSLR